ncbi:hypothetical protein SAMCFNEI73_pB0234 (plasmid) [Sinorhizobium americanum]|uniref:Uncharacterized protein n=1 Tax=Sinorhizobium americanum TaxID=194963 RepID=A0A1L3LTL0_9HYPH|nr:hypothetical protein SAMCFNEI73_pB0234 [Sinorhizobium americanum]
MPHRLIGRTVQVRLTHRVVEIFVSGKQTPSGGAGERSGIGNGHDELL